MWKYYRSCWAFGKKERLICNHGLDWSGALPLDRVDQVGQGSHGDQRHPAETSEREKHNQTLMEISINLHVGLELMQKVALLPWGWGGLSAEPQP